MTFLATNVSKDVMPTKFFCKKHAFSLNFRRFSAVLPMKMPTFAATNQ